MTTDCEDIRRDWWRHWNDGNWHIHAKTANSLIQRLSERLGIVTDKAGSNGKVEHFFFVNVAVGEDDIERIDELFPTPDVTFQILTGVLQAGLKVGFAVNAKNDMTICSLTDRRQDSETVGACLTGGADGWYDALCVCLYKFTALLHGDFAEGSSQAGPARRII